MFCLLGNLRHKSFVNEEFKISLKDLKLLFSSDQIDYYEKKINL